MRITDSWLRDMPQQFLGKPRIEALVAAFARQLEEVEGAFRDLDRKTGLDTAVGANLDLVGTIIPLTRKEAGLLAGINVDEPVISDEKYRQFLRYQLLANTNECTYYDIMSSVELLWGARNVHYVEPPGRPATVLLQLRRADVDEDEDPAEGRCVTVKPAGVGLSYAARYYVGMDLRGTEMALFREMGIHAELDFWTQGRILNGSWPLDGSVLLDTQRKYSARAALLVGGGEARTAEAVRASTVAAHYQLHGQGRMELAYAMRLELEHWGRHGGHRAPIPASMGLKCRVEGHEQISKTTFTAQRNLWYLDGSRQLDGTDILDAAIWKEDL